eukprot:1143240-Pelagomonas_calceolata.AAC.1
MEKLSRYIPSFWVLVGPVTLSILKQLKQLGLDKQCAIRLAHELHAHSVMYAIKLVTTGRAIKKQIPTFHSQVLEPGASSNPPNPHSNKPKLVLDAPKRALLFQYACWRKDSSHKCYQTRVLPAGGKQLMWILRVLATAKACFLPSC